MDIKIGQGNNTAEEQYSYGTVAPNCVFLLLFIFTLKKNRVKSHGSSLGITAVLTMSTSSPAQDQ